MYTCFMMNVNVTIVRLWIVLLHLVTVEEIIVGDSQGLELNQVKKDGEVLGI